MRTFITLKNTFWGIISQVIILLIGFVTRKIFLITLDTTYLGLNGLFTNIISLISIAELGISSAIIYHLYKPIADNDRLEITKLMNLYKDAYRIIAGVITVIGLMFLPFLGNIVNDSSFTIEYLRIIFLIFLFETVVSYFFSYKRSIIFANQKDYIIIINDTIFRILIAIVNIIVLIMTKDFVVYLLSSIAFKIINNIVIAKIADKKYPYIKDGNKLEKEKRKKILIDIKDIFINKLSWIVTNATDNILISIFFNLSVIGLISNFLLLISSVQTFSSKVLDSAQASIGNLLTNGTKEHIYTVFNRLNLLAFLIASFCGVSLFILSSPFVSIWLGNQFLISKDIIAILVSNFFFIVLRSPLWQMMAVSGLFKKEKNIAIIGTIANLIASLILVKTVGIIGVYVGTLISIIIQILLKIPLFFNNFLSMKPIKCYKRYFIFIILFISELLVTYYFSTFILFENKYLEFVILFILCFCIPNILNYLVYRNSDEFIYLKQLVKKILQKKYKNHNLNQL